MAMALALLVTGIVIAPVDAKADEYVAKFSYASEDWGTSVWGDTEAQQQKVTGEGTYSFSWEPGAAVTGAQVFVVDIEGAGAAYAGWSVKDVKVTLDGTELAIDQSKIVVGDTEEKGNFRISFFNPNNKNEITDKAAAPFAYDSLTFSSKIELTFTLTSEAGLNTTFGAAAGGGEETPVATEHTAFLMLGPTAGAAQNWDAAKCFTTVKGDGTYTVTLNASECGGDGSAQTGLNVFCVDVVGLGASVKDVSAIKLDSIKITADGKEVAVDASKIKMGDIEENGNFRLEIFNQWGSGTLEDPGLDAAAFTFTDSVSVEFTLSGIEYGTPSTTPDNGGSDAPALTFDPAGKYNAYLGLQTPNWTYRNAWNDGGYTTDPSLWGDFIYGNETKEKYGKVVDAVVEGNGTYKVSVTDFGTIIEDDFTTANQENFNLLFISTDIPLSDDIKITDVNLYVDGKKVHTDAEAFLDPDSTDYVKILIQNIWNSEKAEISYYPAPTKSVEMEFTISGFNYDKASTDAPADTTTPDTQKPADTEGNANTDNNTNTDKVDGGNNGNIPPIIIVVVVVVVVIAVVAVVVLKKKK